MTALRMSLCAAEVQQYFSHVFFIILLLIINNNNIFKKIQLSISFLQNLQLKGLAAGLRRHSSFGERSQISKLTCEMLFLVSYVRGKAEG